VSGVKGAIGSGAEVVRRVLDAAARAMGRRLVGGARPRRAGPVEERTVFRRALEISLLLHLLLIFVLAPAMRRVWPASSRLAEAMAIRQRPPENEPLTFELVDIPTPEETPPEDGKVPLSDMDRRAHGGRGEQRSRRPGVRGTTPQIVRAEGGETPGRGAPPRRPGPRPVPPAEERRRRAEEPRERPEVTERGAGEEVPAAPEAAPRPAIRLPPPGVQALPPDLGGLPESPDRRGGRVDTGALSFDTRWYDWGPYAAKMLRKIRRNWIIPEIARLGVAGVVKIRFYIERDGTVSGLQILDESGKPPMDFAARDAIARSSPFDPLPSDLSGVEREGVTITFYYNTHPPDWDR